MFMGFCLLVGILLAIMGATAGLVNDQSSRNPIPARDGDFDGWYGNFASNLSALNTTAPGAPVVTFTVVAGVITAGALVYAGYGVTVSGGGFTLPPGVGGGSGVTGTVTAAGEVATAIVIVGGGVGYLGGGAGTFTAPINMLPGTATSSLGISDEQVAVIAANYLSWHSFYTLWNNPGTNTSQAATDKKEARWAASGGKRGIPGVIRPLMRMVTGYLAQDSFANPSHRVANDAMLRALSWHVPTMERTPILPPTKGPTLEIVGYGPRAFQIEYRTVLGTLVNGRPAKQGRGKPNGVKQVQVLVLIPSLTGFGSRTYNLTRSPFWVQMPPEAIGHEVIMAGVWVSSRGDNRPGVSSTSPPGNPIQDVCPGNGVTRRIMGGASSAATALIRGETRTDRMLGLVP